MPRTPHSHGHSEDGGGPAPHQRGGGRSVHPASSVGDVHEMAASALQANRPGGGGNPRSGSTPASPQRALPPGRASQTLAQVRNARAGPSRGRIGEDYAREMYDGGPQRNFPVTPTDDPQFPVTGPGGRNVDVPVDLGNGRTLAVEVKHYKDWKTVTLPSGQKQAVPSDGVPLDSRMHEEINKDVQRRRQDPGYDPRWVFLQAGPSPALRKRLGEAGIIFVEHQ